VFAIPMAWFEGGDCVLPCIYFILFFITLLFIYLPNLSIASHVILACILVDYAYDCARVSGNEM
jgi:hypothetical protein